MHLKNRIIGQFGQGDDGPLLFFVAGIHGNEPSGVKALQEVLDELGSMACDFKGRLVAAAGNLSALGQGVRYVDRDLNRIWIAARQNGNHRQLILAADDKAESCEQRDLFELLQQQLQSARRPVYVIDLHNAL